MAKSTIPDHVPPTLVHDFDVFADSGIGGNVHKNHMALHTLAPDIFYSTRNGGHWMATRFADVQKIMMSPEIFSSQKLNFPPGPPFLQLRLPPQDMDAPDHMRHRLILMKFLAPRDFKRAEPRIRELTEALIDAALAKGQCDFVADVAVPLPVQIFMSIMQWDVSDYRKLVGWANAILATDKMWKAMPAFFAMNRYLKRQIRDRRKNPGDDPISVILASEVDGKPLTDKRVLQMCNLLFLAGLDTVTNAMAHIIRYLAEHPDLQQRLRTSPELIPNAVEEGLRRCSFVNTARRVLSDVEIGGVAMKQGELVVASLCAASNDGRSVASPEVFDIDRSSSPHLTFNTGPHNCAGAALARLEVRILLEEWLRRVPQFHVPEDYVAKARGGPVMALESLPLRW